MNERTLEYARKQLEELRKPALMERKYSEEEYKKEGDRKEMGERKNNGRYDH